jgi:predicted HTH domain antitoxin
MSKKSKGGTFMVKVVLNMSEEVLSTRRKSPQEFGQEIRLAAAIFWYQRGEISQEKASQIAGLNRRDFLAVLAHHNIDVFQVDFDDLEKELEGE